MKILMTGMTSNTCTPDRETHTSYSSARALYEGLKNCEDVELIIGNSSDFNFTEYDKIIVGLARPNTFSSMGRWPNVAIQLQNVDPSKVVLYIDDWHVSNIYSDIPKIMTESRLLFIKKFNEPCEMDLVSANKWWRQLQMGDIKYTILVPMLPWRFEAFDKIVDAINLPQCQYIPWDSSFYVKPSWITNGDKKRQWLLAAKYDYERYIQSKKFTWGVTRYGRRGEKMNGIYNAYLPSEDDVIKEGYMTSWGVLAPPYPVKLRGQWRNKYMLSAWSNDVILSEPGENDGVDEYGVSASDIEKMNISNLIDLARDQERAFKHHSWTAKMFMTFIKRFVVGE